MGGFKKKIGDVALIVIGLGGAKNGGGVAPRLGVFIKKNIGEEMGNFSLHFGSSIATARILLEPSSMEQDVRLINTYKVLMNHQW